ncbi:MAG: serine/threonine protein phosphatase [Marinosulfonomonas sp.]|nr:MAG: serine/threonine protein phosphatase [Marinosulfonomonas sp.]
MLGRLKTLFSAKEALQTAVSFTLPLNPETPFYVIGDVHGCDALLQNLLQKIDSDRRINGREDAPLVLVGDFVDRGKNSAAVLENIKAQQEALPGQVICLMGNHEKMMLDFLDDPAERGPRWLRFGGVQTLASYGISGVTENSNLDDMLDACDALEAAFPEGMESWLRGLPLIWQSGNICCVHAGMSPTRGPNEQETQVLLWGHRDFLTVPRKDDLWVVHGHTVVSQAVAEGGRIAIDTGAYKSGTLTAAIITKDHCGFL